MKKNLKIFGVITCILYMLSYGVCVFAAGYDVIREPWIEDVYEDISLEYGEIGVSTYPTIFNNGISAVYTKVWEVPGEEVHYVCYGNFYLVDTYGNTSELNTNIWESPLSRYNLMYQDESNKESNEFLNNWWAYFPEEFGLNAEPFQSDIYKCIGVVDRTNPSFYNGLARVRKIQDENEYKIGVIDKEENIIVPFIYDWILPISSDGYTWIRKDDKYGIIKINTDKIEVKVNEKSVDFDQIPLIINGRTLAPLRAIFEALDAKVDWDDATQTITSTKDNIIVSMTIGKNEMYKNGEMLWLDEAPQIVGERTLIPVRAIAESFGCNVDWDDATQTVSITN